MIETLKQREKRLASMKALYYKQREGRLAKMKARYLKVKSKETIEQKEIRLTKRREYGRNYRRQVRKYYMQTPERREFYLTKKRIESESEKTRNWRLKREFGITLEDYNELYLKQNGCCAACDTPQFKLKYRLHVDHCHKTGVIRGLLCKKCNFVLGLVNDNIETLDRLMIYLTSDRTEVKLKKVS